MQAHGFAAFIGRDALALASLAASRARTRFGTRIVIDAGDGFRGYKPGSEVRWTEAGKTRGMVVLARIVDRDAWEGGCTGRRRGNGGGEGGGEERISTTAEDLIVHGFLAEGTRADHLERGDLPDGEFSLLARSVQLPDVVAVTRAARDALGTRALFVDERGSIASDHRFLAAPATLLNPGKIFSLRVRREGDGSGGGGEGKMGERAIGGAHWCTEGPGAQEEGGNPETKGAEEEGARTAESLSFETASTRLAELLRLSVGKRVHGHRCVAVSFSGGLDSSILARLASEAADEVILCSAYARNSRDEGQTVRAAEILGLQLDSVLLDKETVAGQLKGLDLPFEPTAMDKALWCLYSTTGRLAREGGCDVMLLGQMADELFGGYMKYALEARKSQSSAREMMLRDARGCADRGFVRDETACSTWIEPRFPYADLQVARFANMLPLSYKIRGNERKAILRSAAILLGVPDALATAPKKAAQFSSGIEKLASMAELSE